MCNPYLIVALLLGTGLFNGAGNGEGELKQSAVIGRDARLLAVQGVAVLPEGGFLVSDKLDYRVKKFAASGTQVAAVGGRGKGPGQFQGPGPIDVHGGRIAVADFAGARIQYFDAQLRHLQSFAVKGAVSDLCFDDAGNLWVVAVTLKKGENLLQFDRQGNQRKGLSLQNARGDLFADAGFVAYVGGGTLAVTYYIQNKIEVWDTSGTFIRQFSVPGLPQEASAHKASGPSGVMIPDGNIFRGMTSDRHGHIYLLVSDYGGRPGREVVVTSPDGEILRHLWLSEKVVQIRSLSDDALVVVPTGRTAVSLVHFPPEAE